MAAEQLAFFDLTAETEPRRAPRLPSRPPRPPIEPVTAAVDSAVEPTALALVDTGVAVVHRYPAALDFLREHGPDAVAVLHVLAADAELVDGRLVVKASTRGVAGRLGFLSKDSAHRRLRQLRRGGVLEALPNTGPVEPPSYVLHLDGTGIAVTHPGPAR